MEERLENAEQKYGQGAIEGVTALSPQWDVLDFKELVGFLSGQLIIAIVTPTKNFFFPFLPFLHSSMFDVNGHFWVYVSEKV